MNCQRYDDLLNDYVDGLRHEEFERHLAACARCQALVEDFTSIRRTCRSESTHSASLTGVRTPWRRPMSEISPFR